MFGLEPHYGCCTANFGQGWPKLALSAFMHSDDTVISVLPVPSRLACDGYSIELRTSYPFNSKFEYIIDCERSITFKVRIPSFAKNITVNGQLTPHTDEIGFSIGVGHTRIEISYETQPELIERPNSLNTVRCGSLIFSLPIAYEKKMYEYEKNRIERKYPYCDYEYLPLGEWSYGYSSVSFVAVSRELGFVPFDSQNPPLVLKAKVKPIAWGLEDGFETVAARAPESRTPIGDEKTVELYPYGCAKLRMTELPLVH